ncbi:MAG: class II aldolase/adducin family protein [Rubrimonas sp.]|uniref:class II aldolase/adducin family protein n=1 Tax=Rubrimonas sp. TaxID=2036015 RepID=UPI002FDD4B50
MKHRTLRHEIIHTCREMNALGINTGSSGNVSARVEEGFLVTPSGVPYDLLENEMIVLMDLDGGYWGDWLPSSEWRMHHDLYRCRPETEAVVHVHSPYAAALSCLREGIPAFHYMIAVAGGADIRCADYATFGTAALSGAMMEAMEGRRACLLANHGQIATGPTLAKALALAVEVETLAKQYHIARQMGAPVLLPPEEMERVLEKFRSYGKQPQELPEGALPAFDAPERRDPPEEARDGEPA